MPEAEERPGLQRSQKIGVILLSIFSVFAIGLGVLQIRNTMYAPFALNNGVPYTTKDDINTNEALIYRDTDKDGLNDFDELYVYITSPYLADTDSDGVDDKKEVEKGTDPTCAEGQNCASPLLTGESLVQSESPSSTLSEPVPPDQDLAAIINNPAEIRKLLLATGLDKEVLDQTSDDELMKTVTELLAASTTNPAP